MYMAYFWTILCSASNTLQITRSGGCVHIPQQKNTSIFSCRLTYKRRHIISSFIIHV